MICLSERGFTKNGISLGEVLLLLAISQDVNLEESEKLLVEKGYITANRGDLFNNKWRATNNGRDMLNSVILDSDKEVGTNEMDSRLNDLVPRLQEIFPEGKKAGTNRYWRGSKRDITERLKSFFKKYDKYTDDQIIEATRQYVKSFNGDYSYMRVLMYFIWKEEVKDGTKSPISELATYIENANQETDSNGDWITTLK